MINIGSVFLTVALAVVSLIIHEWAHVLVIRYMGGHVEKVGFFPLGMVARARRLEYLHGWERYVIYAAGPLVNIIIATWAALTSHLSYVGVAWLDELAFVNLVLAGFNLLPVLPLDGGRLVLQFMGNRMGILRAGRHILRVGRVISILLMILGVVQLLLFPPNFTLLAAGEFLRRQTRKMPPELQAAFHRALDGKNSLQRARLLPVKKKAISGTATIKQAFESLQFDCFITFYIDAKKEHPLTEKALLDYIFTHGLDGTIDESFFGSGQTGAVEGPSIADTAQ
ncbi:MAG: site-2 protease family protein [Defluviitaleaceae bacterium]|nr:site-2 protease family protein [Defluviitaleaceae bacterium]